MSDYININTFIETDISGDWGKEEEDKKHKLKVFCVRGADINSLNMGNYKEFPIRFVQEKSKDKFLKEENIIIEISGGSPTQSTGRVAFLENVDKDIICSNFCRALQIKKEFSAKYVFYLLQNIYKSDIFFNFESKTSGIKNLLYNSAFENIKVPNRDYAIQEKIVMTLSSIDKKIQLLHQLNDNLAQCHKKETKILVSFLFYFYLSIHKHW
ncbi:restriction endonuclease subunit S [Riemerella anatipestifer]|uniref:restriction endonuclease subunit S n=1 Tax=Riemerella anatipestifer TaxID=34085 RepID=UPI00207B92CD|nr:restriction endonuclease subunit S [Riemerella anatipestifer]USL95140.1 restriction endonuclease subunit S [Riemerella anatipestifer]